MTRAIDIAAMAQIQFWDALIVASAEQADATHLYSEDLNTRVERSPESKSSTRWLSRDGSVVRANSGHPGGQFAL